MEFGPAENPEQQSDVDRCIASMAQFAAWYGEPRVYDAAQQLFHPPQGGEAPDALVRRGQVAAQDMAALRAGTPIMYQVVVYTPTGIAKSGLAASLTQRLEALLKAVRYQFTPDKTVVREVITASGSYVEEVSPEEVGFLAEQLATLRPTDHRY